MTDDPQNAPQKRTDDARQGVTGTGTRYVLGISTALAAAIPLPPLPPLTRPRLPLPPLLSLAARARGGARRVAAAAAASSG